MSDYFERIERQFVRRVEASVPRRSRWGLRIEILVPALSAVVVVAIAVVFLSVRGSSSPGLGAGRRIELVYQAEPTPQTRVVTRATVAHAIDVMRERADALGIHAASFRASTGNEITVQLPGFTNVARAERELGQTAQLAFYDWEANVITPNGKTVASQLRIQDPTAIEISQGSGTLAPGNPNVGSANLYQAVSLAAKQTPAPFSTHLSRLGPQYYMFGAPGSAACIAAARANGTTPVAGEHCLLSGPGATIQSLLSGLPAGVAASQGQVLTVAQGWVVLQATDLSASQQTSFTSAAAQFYVLKDDVALTGEDITNPRQSTDATGAPDVAFGFTSTGAKEFSSVTAEIARRGSTVSTRGMTLNLHFAVALDNKLITVPSIGFKQYPDGIPAARGGAIDAGLTKASARSLATEMRLSALPISLRLISASQANSGNPQSARG
ncbi:MAG: hypothetical protein ABSG43_19945 [Solirubrobacteraceae bacterium]